MYVCVCIYIRVRATTRLADRISTRPRPFNQPFSTSTVFSVFNSLILLSLFPDPFSLLFSHRKRKSPAFVSQRIIKISPPARLIIRSANASPSFRRLSSVQEWEASSRKILSHVRGFSVSKPSLQRGDRVDARRFERLTFISMRYISISPLHIDSPVSPIFHHSIPAEITSRIREYNSIRILVSVSICLSVSVSPLSLFHSVS